MSFVTVMTYLLYELVLTGVGHSAANLPSDRPATPPAKINNLAPFVSTGNQRTTIIAKKTEIKDNTLGEFLTVMPYFSELIFTQGMSATLFLATR